MDKKNVITRFCSLTIFLFSFVPGFYTETCFAKNPPPKYYRSPSKHYSYKGETTPKAKTYVCNNCTTMRLFGSIWGGGAWARLGQSQSFTDDATLYSYSPNTSNQFKALWGASVGEEFQFYPDWAVEMGIAYYQTAAFEPKGTVTQGVDPASSNTYHYQYSVTPRQYLLETKFLADLMNGFHPYLTLGVGASFNSVNGYNVTVHSPFPFSTFTPKYASNTNINFSYAVGVGVDYDVVKFARLGIGYRYGWFGNANTGDGEINTVDISKSLKQNNLGVSMGLVQLTFLI